MLSDTELLISANVEILFALGLCVTVTRNILKILLHNRLLQWTIRTKLDVCFILRFFKCVILLLTLVASLGELAQRVKTFERDIFFNRNACVRIKDGIDTVFGSRLIF